jgi:hypothetical protein
VILVELAAEVFADVFAEGLFDEAQVFGDAALGEGDGQELAGAGDDVVFKPLAIEDGDDAVGVGLELDFAQGLADFVFVGGELFSLAVAGVSQDQAGLIEAVAAHHAAGGVGEKVAVGATDPCDGLGGVMARVILVS